MSELLFCAVARRVGDAEHGGLRLTIPPAVRQALDIKDRDVLQVEVKKLGSV